METATAPHTPADDSRPIFREEQRRQHVRFWSGVATAALALMILMAILISFMPETLGIMPMGWVWLLVGLAVAGWAALVYAAFHARLETVVGRDEIRLCYRPLSGKARTIPVHEVAEAQKVALSGAIRDEEGSSAWMPWGRTYKTADDDEAVQVTLKSGEVILIGSKQPDELITAIRKAAA